MSTVEKVKAQWAALPEVDKRIIRFYRQMDIEQILQRIENFGDMVLQEENEKRRADLQHQVALYSIAYLLKEHKINVKGGAKTRRMKRKRRQTRRRQV
jgi:hypothetical protein